MKPGTLSDVPLVRSMSRRTLGAWMQGPLDVTHDETVELCVLERGTMHVRLGDTCGVHRAGEVAIIPPGVRHGSWTEAELITEVIVHLDAARLSTIVREPLEAGVWPADDHPGVRTLGAATVDDPDAVADIALALIAHVRGRASRGVTNDARIVKVVESVGGQLERPWTVADMADLAGLSEAHFARRFRVAVGSPPMRYLQERRLSRAQWLIDASDDPITAIALRVGFGSPSRLTEAFTKRHGVSPSQWRSERA